MKRSLLWLCLSGIASILLNGACVPDQGPVYPTAVPSTPGSSLPSTSTAVSPSESWRVARIVETESSRFQVVETTKIPARNCVGDNVVHFSESLKKTTTHEVTLGGSLTAGLAALIIFQVEANYEVKNGETLEKTVEVQIDAKPKSNLEYQYVWKEAWVDGYVVIADDAGHEQQVPFSLRKSLRGEMADPVDKGCG